MKEVVNSVSIVREGGNPAFDCIKVSLSDEAAGGFLEIQDQTERGDGAEIHLDFDEFDKIVEVVAKYREAWSYED